MCSKNITQSIQFKVDFSSADYFRGWRNQFSKTALNQRSNKLRWMFVGHRLLVKYPWIVCWPRNFSGKNSWLCQWYAAFINMRNYEFLGKIKRAIVLMSLDVESQTTTIQYIVTPLLQEDFFLVTRTLITIVLRKQQLSICRHLFDNQTKNQNSTWKQW